MLDRLIGEYPTLQKVRLQLPALAQSCDPLLIVGENGVGKSLVAAHIHAHSPFAKNKLITVDCSLLDHRSQRLDLFGGSIGDSNTVQRSPLEVQTTVVIKHPEKLFKELSEKLVDAITRGEVTRFRSTKKFPVQSRIIFLLNDTPHTLLRTVKLYPELFTLLKKSRLVKLPPLRQRGDDVLLLARYFARQAHNKNIVGIRKSGEPNSALAHVLRRRQWVRNVLELRAFIAALVIPTLNEVVDDEESRLLHEIKLMIHQEKPSSLRGNLRLMKSHLIQRTLQQTQNNRIRAAHILGRTEPSLH